MDRTPRRRSGGLASLLPSMLLLAVLGGAAGTSTPGSAAESAPLVDLTVRSGSR